MPCAEYEKVVMLIQNYVLGNALVLPGRTSGTKNPDVLILPCGFAQQNERVMKEWRWRSSDNVLLPLYWNMEDFFTRCVYIITEHYD